MDGVNILPNSVRVEVVSDYDGDPHLSRCIPCLFQVVPFDAMAAKAARLSPFFQAVVFLNGGDCHSLC